MLPFPPIRPRRNEGTILPAALAALLVTALALQFAFVRADTTELEPGPVTIAGGASSPPPEVALAPAQPVIEARPIFSPARAGTGAGSEAASTSVDPLAGATVAGAWSVGHRAYLVLRLPNGTSRTLSAGQSVSGWRLVAITATGARFVQAGKSILIPFGAAAPTAVAPSADIKEENPQ